MAGLCSALGRPSDNWFPTSPSEVMTDQVLSEAYKCDLRVNTIPEAQKTYLLPDRSKLETSFMTEKAEIAGTETRG